MNVLIVNHLVQSTLFAAVAAALTLALRRNRAQVRYWLWLAASVKFLVPFAALVALGRQFRWRPPAAMTQPVLTFTEAVGQPFTQIQLRRVALDAVRTVSPDASTLPVVLAAIWFAGCGLMLLTWWVRWRQVATSVHDASAIEHGRELDALRRLERMAAIATPVPLVASNGSFEPGVFGILHPVLLWPSRIGDRLADAQVEAILAHEIAHVRRRDNLAAAVHMVVQSIFWFHPLVWWIGGRLLEERERACDEEVVRMGSEPHVYAESILRTCELYVEAPLVCVAGVTGSDLKKRIESIMRGCATEALSPARRFLLTTAGMVTMVGPLALGVLTAPPLRAETSEVRADARRSIAGPVMIGVLNATRLSAQAPAAAVVGPRFEVASIKPNTSGAGGVRVQVQPGGRYTATNVTLFQLIRDAYRLENFQLSGGPSWINADHFDIAAKAEGGDIPDPFAAQQNDAPFDPLSLMIRSLLKERFKMAVHTETKDGPIYALLPARSDRRLGPQLRSSVVDCAPEARARGSAPPPGFPPSGWPACGISMRPGSVSAGGVTLTQVAGLFSGLVRRTVVDKTALTGTFDLDLRWTPDQPAQPKPGGQDVPPVDPDGASIFTAVQEQLGLKLNSQRGLIEILIIDRAERPTEN